MSARLQPSLSLSSSVSRLALRLDDLDLLRRLEEWLQLDLVSLALGFFLVSLPGRSREPIGAPPHVDGIDGFTPTARRLHRHLSGWPARATPADATGKVPDRSAARICP